MCTAQSNKMWNNKLKNLNTQDFNKLYFTANQVCNNHDNIKQKKAVIYRFISSKKLK